MCTMRKITFLCCGLVYYKIIIPFALAGNEIFIAYLALRIPLAIYNKLSHPTRDCAITVGKFVYKSGDKYNRNTASCKRVRTIEED